MQLALRLYGLSLPEIQSQNLVIGRQLDAKLRLDRQLDAADGASLTKS
jgi:hypothetical protein